MNPYTLDPNMRQDFTQVCPDQWALHKVVDETQTPSDQYFCK